MATQRLHALILMLLVSLTDSCGGGSYSSPTSPSNPAQSIASLSPSSASTGGAAFAFKVNRSNFISASTVQWNGNKVRGTKFRLCCDDRRGIREVLLSARGHSGPGTERRFKTSGIEVRKLESILKTVEQIVIEGQNAKIIPFDVSGGTTRHVVSIFDHFRQ